VIEKGITMKLIRTRTGKQPLLQISACPVMKSDHRRGKSDLMRADNLRRFFASSLMSMLLALAFCPMLAVAQDQPLAAGEGIFWRISQNGRHAGFLLGTIHSEDPRVVDFTEEFITGLKSCQTFAMEMVPDLPTLQKLTDYMHYPEQDQLRSLLGQERFDRAMLALGSYQVPDDWKNRMKVWAVMMTLSVPAPKTGFFMDLSLSLRAAGSGLKVIGLETLEQQLQFLEQMPLDYQIKLLDHALADYQRVAEIHEEMVQVYLQNSLTALAALSEQQFAILDPEITRYFMELGIDARNRQMAAKALPELTENCVFIAVGALHLGGTGGLISLLRQGGYELTALPLPFRQSKPPAP